MLLLQNFERDFILAANEGKMKAEDRQFRSSSKARVR